MGFVSVSFEATTHERLLRDGVQLSFKGRFDLIDSFAVEPPCVVQAQIAPTNTFRFGAFSASYGGRLKNVEVGRYCSLAPGLQVGWDEHPVDWVTSSMAAYVADQHGWETFLNRRRPVTQRFDSQRGVTIIENDVWTGLNVFIRSGVTIGTGSIIGANSTVLHNIPPYSLAAGNPARVKRLRFKENIIEQMLSLQWWRYNIYDFRQDMLILPENFIPYLKDEISSQRLFPYEPGWRGPKELKIEMPQPDFS